jgi:hypothetical protein
VRIPKVLLRNNFYFIRLLASRLAFGASGLCLADCWFPWQGETILSVITQTNFDKKRLDILLTFCYTGSCQTKPNHKKRKEYQTAMNNHITVSQISQEAKPPKGFYIFEKLTRQNRVVDVIRMTRKPKCHIRKISHNEYKVIKTGEVHKFMPKVNQNGILTQMRNRRSLKKIFRDLRQLIECNFEGADCEKFLTLTFRIQTNQPRYVQNCLDLFNKRLKREFPAIGFIHIVEPHASGNWHVHSLLKDTEGKWLNLDCDRMREMWGLGNVHIETLKNVDHLGAYFIAYFTNMEIADEDLHKYQDDIKQLPRHDGEGFKNVIKGNRLDFYPDYMKIFRNSRNMKKPKAIKTVPKEFKKTYEVNFKIETELGDTFLSKEQHKQKRL